MQLKQPVNHKGIIANFRKKLKDKVKQQCEDIRADKSKHKWNLKDIKCSLFSHS